MEQTSEPQVLTSETAALARRYAEVRTAKRGLEAQVKDLDAEQSMIGLDLTKRMEELGLQNFKLEGIGTFFLQTSFYPKVLDQDKMISWLDKHGLTAIAPRTVKSAAFKEMYQEHVEKDLPLPPPDLVDAHSETGVRLRGSK